MARLTRKNNKVFCENAQQSDVGQFGSLNAGTKVETTDIDSIQSLSAWGDGWKAASLGDNCYPTRQERNGLDYVQSYLLNYLYQEGIAEWSANTTYYKGSITKIINGTDIKLYKSLKNNNIAALSDSTAWEEFGYVLKSGDTMTGQLKFSGLNDASGANTPIRTVLDYDTSDATLPSATHYCNGNIANDNQGLRIARSYVRYDQSGNLAFVWGLGNTSNGSVPEKQMNFTVDKNSVATLNVSGNISATGQIDLSAHSTTSSSAGIIDTLNYDISSANNPSSNQYANMQTVYDLRDERIAYSTVTYTTDGVTRINNVVFNGAGEYTQTYLGIDKNETANNKGIFYFPKCRVAPTTISSAADNKVSVVVANYLNNDSGYIVYSDGLIKQWGRVTGGQTDNTVVLPKKMTTSDYSVVFTQLYITPIIATCTVSSMTTKNFIVHLGNGNYDAMWQVIGY